MLFAVTKVEVFRIGAVSSLRTKASPRSGLQGFSRPLQVFLRVARSARVRTLAIVYVKRGHPYMTSAKFWDFLTPSPLVRIWD